MKDINASCCYTSKPYRNYMANPVWIYLNGSTKSWSIFFKDMDYFLREVGGLRSQTVETSQILLLV